MTTATVHQQRTPGLSTVISLFIAIAAVVIAVIALMTAAHTTSTAPAPTPAVVQHAPVLAAPAIECRGHRVGSAC
jgi:hypothetical protein